MESSASAVNGVPFLAGGIAALGITVILFNPGAGLRFDRSFSLVLQKSHARRFRDGRRDLACSYTMAFIRLWWVSNRSTSHEVGWSSNR